MEKLVEAVEWYVKSGISLRHMIGDIKDIYKKAKRSNK